ncbi:Nitroreductase-like protein [Phaeosphaeria sp. MPI-PUGE-AT-0046c]|nr:Nitroreductase-like protein [Phaeosphaeria sp. MPI-PUGE-AT-0046c]
MPGVQHTQQSPRSIIDLVLSRHSTRAFLAKPVARSVIEQILEISQRAPSNSNLQPWRVKVVTGKALERLSSALSSTFWSGTPNNTKPIPEIYNKYRSALGKQLYGPEGYDIPRNDEERTRRARMRNYQFFGAPCALMICIEQGLAEIDVLSIGMYLQTICLLLSERGISTCVEASVAGYPQVVRQELGLRKDMIVLAGVAVGYEDRDHKINHLKGQREALENNVEFLDD